MNTEQASKNVFTSISSDFSMLTISSFKDKENKHDVYRGEKKKKFCECLKNHEVENEVFLKNRVYNKRAAKMV